MSDDERGEPTHYLPLWEDAWGYFWDASYDVWEPNDLRGMAAIPASRVTVTP